MSTVIPDAHFPSLFQNFEGLRNCAPRLLSAGWSLVILADVGVPFMKIMDAYESQSQRNDRIVMGLGGVDVERHTEKLAAVVELLDHWIKNAQSNSRATGTKNTAFQELSREMASGRLRQKMDQIRGRIENLPSGSQLLDQFLMIEEGLQFIL